MRLWILLTAALACMLITTEALPEALEQIGANDFQISDMDGPPHSEVTGQNDVAFNPHAQEYFVVWSGANGDPAPSEVHGQRLDLDGGHVGPFNFLISQLSQGNPSFGSFSPRTLYNPDRQEYLVVWSGEDFFQASILISDLGGFGDADFDAGWPAVALHPVTREWWVVWYGNDDERGLVELESEIFGQRLTVSGAEVGVNDFRISAMGGLGIAGFTAFAPALAYDGITGDMVVTWSGNDRGDDLEIHGSRLRSDGSPTGPSCRLSDVGPEATPTYYADFPAIAQNDTDGQFLVTFVGRDDALGHLADELDLLGQRLILAFFADGFETGDLSAWSQAVP